MALQIIEVHQQKNQKFIACYNVKRETAIAFIKGPEITMFTSSNFWKNEQTMLFHVRHHWWNKGIQTKHFVEFDDSMTDRQISYGNQSFSVLDLAQVGLAKSWVHSDSLQ
ncbi:MAG TPA: hypothetical protein DCR04_10605 [Flavobacteriales bacterium]|nr:hypothetical protein [Flavobacteriales bacterium]